MPEKKNEPEKIDGGRTKIVHSPFNIMNLCKVNVNNTANLLISLRISVFLHFISKL